MIKKTKDLEPGDILPFNEGRAEVVERFHMPSGGAGALSGLYKITGKILDSYDDSVIEGENYITFCDGNRPWRVEGLEELEA